MNLMPPPLSPGHPTSRAAAPLALAASVVAFVVLFYAAARAYPGGTHFDHASIGHDLWRNTLCDVTRTVALDGSPNGAACTLARAAMIALAGGLGVFFMVLPRLFRARARAAALVRVLGSLAAVGAIAVVLLPGDRFGAWHGVAVVSAGLPGLAASLVALHAVARERTSARAVLLFGALALGVAALDFVLYVSELLSGGASQLAVSVLERIATALLLAWMLAVAHEVSRSAEPRSRQASTRPAPRAT
jgi:hypothetical protein